jgi:leader peptidase (prepilin peptidase)/N-methyltransferase
MSTTSPAVLLSHPIALAALGAIVGSFLNVVIHRHPRGQSLIRPRSTCPQCGTALALYDNIPLVSWILLRGKCRSCRGRISARYPLVELLAALLFAATGARITDALQLGFSLMFIAFLIAVAFIDLEHMIIPDSITLPGIGVGVAAAFLGATIEPVQAVLGSLAGGGGLLAVAIAYRAVRRREGIGMGDVKLLAMIGAFLGPAGALLTLLMGSVLGTLFGLIYIGRASSGRSARFPFGTFLSLGALLNLLWNGGRAAAWITTS